MTGQPLKVTEYDGEFIYQGDVLQFINHEEGRIINPGSAPEYQFHLKDHLGNVRMTVTSATLVPEQYTATYEDSHLVQDQAAFLRVANARRVVSYLFDHTNGTSPSTTTGDAERLSGGTNEIYGLARSISVMPGDVIRAEVYGKYVDPVSGNRTTALNTLLSLVATATPGVVVDGSSYSSSTSSFPWAGLLASGRGTAGPKAYLNWLIFDRNFVFITGGFTRMSATPKETGSNVAHELLSSGDLTITQPGYVYIYLSNEEATPMEVYFDDFTVKQTKSAVVQMDDYYPFGLTFNSYSRENAVPQNFKYNGKELQTDLSLNWEDYGARMYMPEIGRWGVIDPLSEKYLRWSQYNYCMDNPMKFIDPDGRVVWIIHTAKVDGKTVTQAVRYSNGVLYNPDGSKYKGANAYLKTVQKQLNEIKKLDSDIAKMVTGLEKSNLTHNIYYDPASYKEIGASNHYNNSIEEKGSKLATGSDTNLNPYDNTTVRGRIVDPRATLAHELKHASDKDNATTPEGKNANGVPLKEVEAVKVENKINKAIGQPLRTTYGDVDL